MAYFIDIIVLIAHIYYLYIYKMIDIQDYNVYFYIFYVVFMTSLLLLNFYHIYKKENYYSIVEIIIYSIFVKFNFFFTFITHFSQVIDDPFYLKYMIVASYTILLCYIIYNIYAFLKYYYYQKKYIKQLETDLKNNEVHLLRHNVSEFLHQINNDIQIQNYQKAQNSIQTFIEKQYQSTSTIISTIPSLNDIFN